MGQLAVAWPAGLEELVVRRRAFGQGRPRTLVVARRDRRQTPCLSDTRASTLLVRPGTRRMAAPGSCAGRRPGAGGSAGKSVLSARPADRASSGRLYGPGGAYHHGAFVAADGGPRWRRAERYLGLGRREAAGVFVARCPRRGGLSASSSAPAISMETASATS